MFFWCGLPFLVLVVCGAAGTSACVQVHCFNAAMACCFRRSKAVCWLRLKKFLHAGRGFCARACGPRTRPGRASDD